MSIEKAEKFYRELSSKIFKMNNLLGIGQLFLTQSFYSSSDLEKQVRKFNITEKKLYETSCDPIVPRVREGGRGGRERGEGERQRKGGREGGR